MARVTQTTRDAVSLGRLDSSTVDNGGVDAANQLASVAGSVAGTLMEKRRQYQALEDQKQEALATIDINKAHAEMGAKIQSIQNQVEKDYADNPDAGKKFFDEQVGSLKQQYDDQFYDNIFTRAKWTPISENMNTESASNINSWVSAQQLTNATKSYRTTQAARIQTAGSVNNLSDLYKVYRESNDDYETTQKIFSGTKFDAAADQRTQITNITKEFLNGQLDRSPGSVEAYLQDPMIQHHLSQDEIMAYKKGAKQQVKYLQAEAEEADRITNILGYIDTYEGIINGTVTVGQLNGKIDNLVKTGASPERVEQWGQLKLMLLKSNKADEEKAQAQYNTALTEAEKVQQAKDKAIYQTNTKNSLQAQYMSLFTDKEGNLKEYKDFSGTVEQTAKLLNDINVAERNGVSGLDAMRKKTVETIRYQLESGSQIYKTKLDPSKSTGKLPNLFGMGDEKRQVPVDDFNKGLKTVVESITKNYSDGPGRIGVKVLAVSDYMSNYQKYKQMGMSDKEIQQNVVVAAQKVYRGEIQATVDSLWQQKTGGGFNHPYVGLVNQSAAKYNISPTLVNTIMKMESGFNPNAMSGVGAQGLMQLMPATAKGLGVTKPYDPAQNIEAGTKHIAGLLAKYKGNVKLAVAAYNAGGGSVDDFLNGTNKTGKNPNHIKTEDGVPPWKETQNYVKNVLAHMNKNGGGANNIVAKLKAKGYSDADIAEYKRIKGLS